MSVEKERIKIRDAIKEVNQHLKGAGVRKVHLDYLESSSMLSDHFGQATGDIVHHITCKRDTKTLGVAPEKLGTIFVHGERDGFSSIADAQITRVSKSQFESACSYFESAKNCLDQSIIDELLDVDEGYDYLMFLNTQP